MSKNFAVWKKMPNFVAQQINSLTMKKLTWLMGLALLGMVVLGACSDKKVSKNVELDDEDEELVEDEDDADDSNIADFDEAADDDEDMDEEDRPMTPEEQEIYENEVWMDLGGTYFFYGDPTVILDVSLDQDSNPDEDTRAKLSIGDEEFRAFISNMTGQILAYDDDDHVVFDGFVTAGGNMIRGTFRGKPIKVASQGD